MNAARTTPSDVLWRWQRGVARACWRRQHSAAISSQNRGLPPVIPVILALLAGALLPHPAEAQIAFRGASSAAGPGTGAITFRAATSAASGNIVFRAASNSGTPTSVSPAFRAAASASAASGILTLTIARPANTVENDVMIASVGVSASSPTITAPFGWTLVRQTTNATANANSLAVYRKVATAAEPANYTWTFSASTGAVGGIQTFFNVDTVNPIDVENGQTTPSGTTHATPSVTTTMANTMLVTSHTFSSSRTWTAPGGMTESFDARSIPANNAAGQSIEGNRQVQAAAGATGVKTANAGGNADVGNTHILALRPALRIAQPAGTAQGDVMIAAIAVQPNTTAITPPAGWTLVNRIDQPAATASSLAVYRRTAGATEPSSYAWGVSGATFMVGGIQSFSGVDSVTPIDVQNGQTTPSALTHATPSVTTTVANTMVVTSHTLSSSRTWTPPAGMTESFDVASPAPNNAAGQALEGSRVVQAAAGATGAKTATVGGNADTGATHILALRPSGTSITIARPATAIENDVMIAAIGITPTSVTVTPPSGWTLIRRTNNAGGVTNSLAVFMKVATATEPGSYYWPFSAAATAVGGIQAFAGVDTSNAIDIENGQTTPSATTHATPNVATTVANTMVVTHHTYSSSQNWTPPGGMTESFDQRSAGASATGQSIEGNRVLQAAAGATGVKTATAAGGGGSADFGNTHILALRPQATNDIDLPTPAGTAAGDVMIAAIGFQPQTLTITPPAGWTSIRRTVNAAGTANTLETFRRTAIAGEPAVHRFAFSAVATAAAGGVQSFAGVDTALPVNVENGQTTASALTHATPSVATTVANTMIVTAHTFASSATWAPPAGMIESADRANLAVPNAAGQSLELNRVEQGSVGATGVKTATASANADTGATHILALRPAPIIAIPGRFNAYDGAPAGINGVITTKIAGSAFSLAVVAVNAAGTAVEAGFSGDVKVEVVDSSSGGPVDAANCNAAWPVVATLPVSWTVTLANGVGTVAGITVANAFPNLRIRMIYPIGATYAGATAKGCSTDNFAMRPNTLANFSVTDNDWQTAGIARTLANAAAAGGNVHKAGRPFTVRADAVNSAAAITTNYAGAPTTNLTACVGTACMATFGTLTLTTTFAAGQLASNAATYAEAGSFNLQLVDSTFASVDAADTSGDCTAAGRYVCSTTINVGRFVPDHFDVTPVTAPVFRTFNDAACATRSFTYIGQRFRYATMPVAMIEAKDSSGGTTTNYTGALWKLTNASASQAFANSPVMLLDTAGITTPTVSETAGTGTGTYTANASDAIAFVRDNAVPQAPFNSNLSLTLSVSDASEAGASQGTITTSTPLLFNGGGSGIGFDSGNAFRYGRLRIGNANGSQLVPLPVQVEAQYWSGAPTNAFITNIQDSCTSIASANDAMGNYTGNLSGLPTCETAISGGGTLNAGRRTLQLAAPGSGNNGSVDLTVNLGAAASGNTCTSVGGAPGSATTANLPHLQGNWTGAAYDQNPTARATFGVFKGAEEIIFVRENF